VHNKGNGSWKVARQFTQYLTQRLKTASGRSNGDELRAVHGLKPIFQFSRPYGVVKIFTTI
jgi:hypothetical protein